MCGVITPEVETLIPSLTHHEAVYTVVLQDGSTKLFVGSVRWSIEKLLAKASEALQATVVDVMQEVVKREKDSAVVVLNAIKKKKNGEPREEL